VKRGVLLFNLGGPETLEDVRPFLYNLFSDPEIIRIKSSLLRKMLAWCIAAARQGKSRDLYRQIGGGSPLRKITEAQAAALSAVLNSKGMPTGVYVGMRCWKPNIDDAVDQILRDQVTHLVLLPLFPQYSVTTTGSCLNYFRTLDQKLGLSAGMQISTVESWFEEPLYIEAMADLIREALQAFSGDDGEKITLLYSAHSIPARYVDEGDPYLEQTRSSVKLISSRLQNKHSTKLAFQSKVGPVKWLSPATKDVVVELGREGNKRVLAVPVSFVSDHIETLQEIDIQYRNLAAQSGITEFHRAASLNLYPKFIDALAEIAIRSFAEFR
jgi:protoporphyrin/coproporphyrin ferrochelatase